MAATQLVQFIVVTFREKKNGFLFHKTMFIHYFAFFFSILFFFLFVSNLTRFVCCMLFFVSVHLIDYDFRYLLQKKGLASSSGQIDINLYFFMGMLVCCLADVEDCPS